MELSTYSSTKTINEFENAIEIFNNTIADFFNETTSYIIDDFVIYEGNLYQCINNCIGTWNSSNWQIQKIFDNNGDDIIKEKGEGDQPSVPNYLCFTAEEDNSSVSMAINGTFTGSIPELECSLDKNNWESFNIGEVIILDTGDKVYFRGDNDTFNESGNYMYFVMTGSISASGNIMSLIDSSCESLTTPDYAFKRLFADCSSLITPPELPATTLATDCYRYMFINCTSLVTAPRLPAKALPSYCYNGMFQGCIALNAIPAFIDINDAITMSCNNMFKGCTNIFISPRETELDINPYKITARNSAGIAAVFKIIFMGIGSGNISNFAINTQYYTRNNIIY